MLTTGNPQHAFHRDDSAPLAESIVPMGDGQRVILCQLYPEGSLTALGYLDEAGEFVGTSGNFRAFRSKDLFRFEDKS